MWFNEYNFHCSLNVWMRWSTTDMLISLILLYGNYLFYYISCLIKKYMKLKKLAKCNCHPCCSYMTTGDINMLCYLDEYQIMPPTSLN